MTAFTLLLVATMIAADPEPVPPQVYARTVFVGDSITDGNTYPTLVATALEDAKLPAMRVINAGIGGDTAKGMLGRLDRDVLAHKPTLVLFNAGANDANRGVTPEDFEADVHSVVERLTAEKVPVILLTTQMVGPRLLEKNTPLLSAYDAAFRRIALEHNLRIGEVGELQREADIGGVKQLEGDDLHPNYEGQRTTAAVVLDTLGYPDLVVPARGRFTLRQGVISPWKLKNAEGVRELTAEVVAAAKPDDAWFAVTLPEAEPHPDAWLDDARMEGACVSLGRRAGEKGPWLGTTTIESDGEKKVQFHTGCGLTEVWLNGEKIYKQGDWRGWHLGRQSVPATLKPGANTVVILTGAQFFLSVTDGGFWD